MTKNDEIVLIRRIKEMIGLDVSIPKVVHGQNTFTAKKNILAAVRNQVMEEAVDLGYMEKIDNNSNNTAAYFLTQAGAEWFSKKTRINLTL